MWILLDNYDSFTGMLHHYLLQTGADCSVVRNDALSLEGLKSLHPERLIISPGPCTPDEAGISREALAWFVDKIPVLGLCLGHQALGMHFGADLQRAPQPRHGKSSMVSHNDHPLFEGIPSPFPAARYHSLAIENLERTGLNAIAHADDDGCVMAIAHDELPAIGIQFHPESCLTTLGMQLLQNWADMW